MNDLLDASNGVSADGIANMVLDDLKFGIQKFNPCTNPDSTDISNFVPTASGVKDAFNQMSSGLKPLELTRIMKGQRNKKDYENMTACILDENMRLALSPSAFDQMMDVVSDFADLKMLQELESAYDNKEVMVSVCKDNGIPYCLRDIKDTLENKYTSFSDDEICELIEDIVEETKDSLVDAIGNLKEDFEDSLPFNDNPCSFMPKPSEIPAMNFVNDIAFDSIFNPIELEYKAEAVSFPDLMMQSTPSEEYVKLRLEAYDSAISEISQDPNTGIFDITYKFVYELVGDDFIPDLDDENGGLYNQEFGNHYFGTQTPVYFLDSERKFIKASAHNIDILKNEKEEYYMAGGAKVGGHGKASDKNLYVKKIDENLTPMPELKKALLDSNFTVYGYGHSNEYSSIPGITTAFNSAAETIGDRIAADGTYANNSGYIITFPNLSSAKIEANWSSKEADTTATLSIEATATPIWETVKPPSIIHDLGAEPGIGMIFPTVESLNNPACIDTANEPTNLSTDITHMYVAGIADTIEKTINASMNQHTVRNYEEAINLVYDGYDRVYQSTDVAGDEGRDSVDLIASLTLEIAQTYMRSFVQSELFETNEMLTFLFDTEDINLFKIQDAKNSAKDEYNEDCDFTDDKTSKLKTASIKKLIYLTIRIYLIDVLTQGCFINSVAYDEELSPYLVEYVFQYMKAQLSLEKDSYYTVFSDLYSQQYGEEIEDNAAPGKPSTSFKELCDEIWTDISPELPKIFPNAGSSTLTAFLDNTTHFYGTEEDFAPFLYDTYMASRGDPDNNSRFLIKLVYIKSDGTEEFFHHEANSQMLSSPGVDLVMRLCYVVDFRKIQHIGAPSPPSIDLDDTSLGETSLTQILKEIEHAPSLIDEEYELEEFRSQFRTYKANFTLEDDNDYDAFINKFSVQKIKKTVSYNYVYILDTELGSTEEEHPHLLCLPIAQTSAIQLNRGYGDESAEPRFESLGSQLVTDGTVGNSQDNSIHAELDALYRAFRYTAARYDGDDIRAAVSEVCNADMNRASHTIYDFVVERMRSEAYFDLLRRTLISKMQQLKPETALAFQDTKSAIRMAILSLSQEKDNFEFIQQEPIAVQLAQSQEVGTSPDFSPKAKKMALMTVPMIVKGMAEMFDPNTKLASLIRKGADAAGMNISPPVASLMAMPFNIIPFAPGPPITPLGLTYLATSFLEPKERKKLSNIKRGKNVNPSADGTILSPEQQMAEREASATEAKRLAINAHREITSITKAFAVGMTRLMILFQANTGTDVGIDDLSSIDVPNDYNSVEDVFGDKDASSPPDIRDVNWAVPNHLNYSDVIYDLEDLLRGIEARSYNYEESTGAEDLASVEHHTKDDTFSSRPYDTDKEDKSLGLATYLTFTAFEKFFKSSGHIHQAAANTLEYMRKMSDEEGNYSIDHLLSHEKFRDWIEIAAALDAFYYVAYRAFSLYVYSIAKVYHNYGLQSMAEKYEIDFYNNQKMGIGDIPTQIDALAEYYLAWGGEGADFVGFVDEYSGIHGTNFRDYFKRSSLYNDTLPGDAKTDRHKLSMRIQDRYNAYGDNRLYTHRIDALDANKPLEAMFDFLKGANLYKVDSSGSHEPNGATDGLYGYLLTELLDNIVNPPEDTDPTLSESTAALALELDLDPVTFNP